MRGFWAGKRRRADIQSKDAIPNGRLLWRILSKGLINSCGEEIKVVDTEIEFVSLDLAVVSLREALNDCRRTPNKRWSRKEMEKMTGEKKRCASARIQNSNPPFKSSQLPLPSANTSPSAP